MLYGVNVYIDFWGISSKTITEEYPKLKEYLGKNIFKTKSQRDNFVRKIESLVLYDFGGGWTCGDEGENDVLEITDYGTFSILVNTDKFEEEFKPIKERRKRRVFSEG